MKKVLLLFIAFTLSLLAQPFATVLKLEGKAKVQHTDSISKAKLAVGAEINRGDTLLTYRKTKLVIQLNDKTKIVLDEYVKLKLLSINEYEQNGGKVFYKVTKRKGAKGLKVKTPFAIIGVKGTEFLVTDNNNSKELALNEGLVGVDSPNDKPFEKIDKDKLDASIVQTPGQVQAEFEAYKKELMKQFTEYVKSFDLKPGKKLSFNGNTVYESTQSGSDASEFKDYKSDAGFKAISDELDAEMGKGKESMDDAMNDSFFDN